MRPQRTPNSSASPRTVWRNMPSTRTGSWRSPTNSCAGPAPANVRGSTTWEPRTLAGRKAAIFAPPRAAPGRGSRRRPFHVEKDSSLDPVLRSGMALDEKTLERLVREQRSAAPKPAAKLAEATELFEEYVRPAVPGEPPKSRGLRAQGY